MINTVNASEINNTDSISSISDDTMNNGVNNKQDLNPKNNVFSQGINDNYDLGSRDYKSHNVSSQKVDDEYIFDSVGDVSENSLIQNSVTKNFTNLQNEINKDADNLILDGTYKYDNSTDNALFNGVTIQKNLTIIGQNCVIDGNNLVRCLNISSSLTNFIKVTLENITILNGFLDNPYQHTPLKEFSGAGISVGTNVNLILKNCIFKNNKVINGNGAALITNEYCTVKIDNCTFENNTSERKSDLNWDNFKAGMASAIYSKWGSTLSIMDSSFKSNNAYLTTILLVSYHNATTYDLSKLYVKNCYFEGNTAKKRGVIYLDELGEGEILNSTFINNHSPESTGIVVLDSSKSAIIKHCYFEGNTGVNGAAIYVDIFEDNPSKVQIDDCNFINNFASNNGGAVYSNGGSLVISGSTFNNNHARNGGSIYSISTNTNIVNTNFLNNVISSNGGAVYSNGGSLVISGSTFNNNHANLGGAIYSTTTNAYITHTNFLINTANNKGANIYLKEFAYLDNCIYYGNNAPNDYSYSYGISNNFKVKGNIITSSSIKTTYNTLGKKLKITLKNSKTNQYIVGVKLKINVFTGKKYKTYYITTNDKGFTILNVPKLSAGTHKVTIMSAESCVINSAKTINIIISKAKANIISPKITKKFKSKSYFKIIVKYKTTKKVIPNIKVKIRITHRKNIKTIYKKTNKKGIIKISTKSLKRGKHKVTITSANSNISFTKKSTIVIR